MYHVVRLNCTDRAQRLFTRDPKCPGHVSNVTTLDDFGPQVVSGDLATPTRPWRGHGIFSASSCLAPEPPRQDGAVAQTFEQTLKQCHWVFGILVGVRAVRDARA